MTAPVYLDNNATTMVAPEVFEEMRPYFSELYGNPSSLHSFGGNVAHALDEARQKLAALLGAGEDELIFTSCGTESDATAIHSALEEFPDKRHIVTSSVEHPAVLGLCGHLEKQGYEVTYLGVDEQGRLDLDELAEALRDDTAIVSLMHANNESGVVFPLAEITDIVKARGILMHTDAVQSVGKLPLDLGELPVDFLSLSGHKLHAPKGVGALFVRRGAPFSSLLMGGHQEDNRRAGTENVASIVALGKAAELAAEHVAEERDRVSAMRDRLQEELVARCPDTLVNGGAAPRLPNTLSISFGYVEGESIVLLLDELGIYVSTGSACSSDSLEVSHVISCMNVPEMYAHGSIRFSLSRYNTAAEIDYVSARVPEVIKHLRELSPYGRA
jgi:cysteine desulfurase